MSLARESRLRVAFLGNGFEYSLSALRVLVEHKGVELVAVVSPQRGGDKRVSTRRGAVKQTSRRLAAQITSRLPSKVTSRLPTSAQDKFAVSLLELTHQTAAQVYWPPTLNDPGLVDEIALLNPELVVMAGYSEILKPVVLSELSPIINMHPSLLPHYRGPYPEFWIIAEGERESGVTLHYVDEGIDTGAIAAQSRFEIEPWLTGGALHHRNMRVGAKLLATFIDEFQAGARPKWEQEEGGSYYGKLADDQLVLPFWEPAARVYNLARAVEPWTGLTTFASRSWWELGLHKSHTTSAGRRLASSHITLKLRHPRFFPDFDGGTPGTLRRTEDDGLAVACQAGCVFFRTVEVG